MVFDLINALHRVHRVSQLEITNLQLTNIRRVIMGNKKLSKKNLMNLQKEL